MRNVKGDVYGSNYDARREFLKAASLHEIEARNVPNLLSDNHNIQLLECSLFMCNFELYFVPWSGTYLYFTITNPV